MRDVVIMKEYLPSATKKRRPEMYVEDRRLPSKPMYKAADLKAQHPVVIEKKPVLNAGYLPKTDWQALPQRKLPEKRKAVIQKEEPQKPANVHTAKPVESLELKQKVKEVTPTTKVASAVKEVTRAVKEVTPAVKEVTTAAKEVTTAAKDVAPAVKKVAVEAKEVTTAAVKVTPIVKEVVSTVKEVSTTAVKEDEDKKTPEMKSVAEPDLAQRELDALTARMLHDELQQIMIKVWQELPDAPPTEAERLVADKFRNEAGDDLQNAMGLSVTMRLLNIHNPLYAKLLFSGKPEPGCLQDFIRTYNITAFKRIVAPDRDLFAARFDRPADYDRLCAHTQLKCGSANVSITPCYKHLSCPPSIKTIYAIDDNETAKLTSTNSSPQKRAESCTKEKIAPSENAKTIVTKVAEKKLNTETGKRETTAPVTKTANADNKKSETVTQENKNVTTVTNTEAKKGETVTQANKTATGTAAKTEIVNTDNAKTLAQEKPKAEAPPAELNKVTPKKVENKQEVATEAIKVTPKKVESIEVEKKNNTSDNTNKQMKTDGIEDMMVVDEMDEEDEEMTDQDILALMSGGIVLDECSGSDDEK